MCLYVPPVAHDRFRPASSHASIGGHKLLFDAPLPALYRTTDALKLAPNTWVKLTNDLESCVEERMQRQQWYEKSFLGESVYKSK